MTRPIDGAFRILKEGQDPSEMCDLCAQFAWQNPNLPPCKGPKYLYDGGAGGITTLCDSQLQQSIDERHDDPSVDDSWIEDVVPIR